MQHIKTVHIYTANQKIKIIDKHNENLPNLQQLLMQVWVASLQQTAVTAK